ncbi:MAG: endolytic transglycosylase MltG [Clostridia bacterium]|nr:endolytic transglycosylase MltG [Clostridia bacterium]
MAERNQKEISAKRIRWMQTWKILRPIATAVISVAAVVLIVSFGARYILSNFVYPVDSDDATPIEVVIPESSSAGTIAQLLYTACGEGNEGLIVNTASFKIYVDFVGKAGSLKAGTYILSKNMSIAEIVDILCAGNPARQTTRITIPEGYTVEDIAKLLVDSGLIDDEAVFLNLCNDSAMFSNYSFIAALDNRTERKYLLEGYLFPDTYEVYVDGTCEEIIQRMLSRFDAVYTGEYVTRANELGMTMNQVITLASIIEREARDDEDFVRVSAVFHNRIAQGMNLESCATLSYALGVNKYTFTTEELATVSAYNTYRNSNLPIGPISNPGERAILAALYPDETFMAEGYLYFCNMDINTTTALVFSKTYEEHLENVELYSQYWD